MAIARPDFNLKSNVGTTSVLLANIEELNLFQSYIREYISQTGAPNDIGIISVTPIPSQYTGSISGKVKVDSNTTLDSTSRNNHTVGDYVSDGNLPLSLSITSIQFLLTYDVTVRS